MIEHDGKTTTFAELSKQVGVGAETLRQRYKNGARGADLVKNTRQTIEHDGARISFEALSKQVGVSVDTLRKRYRKGKRGACLVAAAVPGPLSLFEGPGQASPPGSSPVPCQQLVPWLKWAVPSVCMQASPRLPAA